MALSLKCYLLDLILGILLYLLTCTIGRGLVTSTSGLERQRANTEANTKNTIFIAETQNVNDIGEAKTQNRRYFLNDPELI